MIGDPEAEASSSREGWKHRHISQCPLEAGEGAPSHAIPLESKWLGGLWILHGCLQSLRC